MKSMIDSRKSSILVAILLVSALSLLLAACSAEGIGAFSPANNWVAVITNNKHLFTTDLNGGSPVLVDTQPILNMGVSSDPSGSQILYAVSAGICLSNPRSTTTCTAPLVPLPSGVSVGQLSFLPNGQFILVYQLGNQWGMQIYNANGGSPVVDENNIDQFFLPASAFKVESAGQAGQWRLTPYKAQQAGQDIRLVFLRGNQMIRYNLSGNVQGPLQVGQIDDTTKNLINSRDEADVTSAILSPDGTRIAFRTQAGQAPNASYGLYILNLATPNSQPVNLVNNANFPIQFSFSPNGAELAYESNLNGRSVWIANSDGGNPRKLADNSSLPIWR